MCITLNRVLRPPLQGDEGKRLFGVKGMKNGEVSALQEGLGPIKGMGPFMGTGWGMELTLRRVMSVPPVRLGSCRKCDREWGG
jgi:hypothetical protein